MSKDRTDGRGRPMIKKIIIAIAMVCLGVWVVLLVKLLSGLLNGE